jgi:hypothetical protein
LWGDIPACGRQAVMRWRMEVPCLRAELPGKEVVFPLCALYPKGTFRPSTAKAVVFCRRDKYQWEGLVSQI